MVATNFFPGNEIKIPWECNTVISYVHTVSYFDAFIALSHVHDYIN